jgi:hypothetical protein
MAETKAKIVISARDDTGAALAKARAGFASLSSDLSGIGAALGGLSGAISGAFSATALVSFFKSTVNGIDALNDLKDATGSSIENLSALEDVADRTGSSFESVGQALVKFNSVLKDAKAGSDTAKVLSSIGLSAEQLRKQDPAESLRQVAVALAGFADDGQKARIVSDLFGKSIKEVAPLLNDLSKQTSLVGKVTTERAEAAEKFNQQLASLAKNAKDAARGIVSDLLPQASELVKRFSDAQREGTLLVDTLLNLNNILRKPLGGDVLDAFSNVKSSTALARLEQLAAGLENIRKTDEAAGREENKNNTRRLENINKQIAALKQLEIVGQGFAKTASSFGGQKLPSAPDTPGSSDKTAKVISEFDKYLERLKAAQIATLNLSAEEQARYDIAYGDLKKLNDIQQAIIITNAQALDALKSPDEFTGPQIPLEELNRRNEAAKDVASFIAETTQGQINTLTRQYGNLDEALRNGTITSKQYVDALDLIDEKFGQLTAPIAQATQEISEFSKQAARNIQDAVGDSVLRALEGDFDSILDLWANMLAKMVAQAIAADLNNALFGGLFGASGQGVGLIGSLFGGAFADGGFLQPGKVGLVGENGPELIMAGSAGATVTPNSGSTVNVTYSIGQIGSGVSRGEVIAGLNAVRESTKAEVMGWVMRKAGV